MNKIAKSVIALGLVAVAGSVSAQSAQFTGTSVLRYGSRGAEVKLLQQTLNMCADTTVATAGAGSKGMETTTYGRATEAAVKKYQAKNGIITTGKVGSLTRAKLNMGNTCADVVVNPTNPVTPVTGPVAVSLAATSPNGTRDIAAGQAAAHIASVTFTGNGVVSNVQLMRTGMSTNDTLRNVYLYDGAVRLTDAASVTSDGKVTFNGINLAVAGSKTVDIRADVLSTAGGNTVGLSLVSYTLAGATTPVSVANVMGANLRVSTVSAAGFALPTNNQSNTNRNVNAGTVNQNVWDVTATVSTRAVTLKGLTLKYVGSAANDALANLSLYVDGVKVGNTATINAMGLLSFDLSASPVTLATGSRTIQVRGDFMKGSGRTAQFYFQNSADFMVEDSQLSGVFITPTTTVGGSVAATSVYGYNFQIQNGSLVVSQDATWNASQVVGGATNTTLGKFTFKAYGEDVKVENLVITPSGTFTGYTSGAKIQNVTLYVNGAAVGSSQNWTSGTLTFTPNSNMIVPAGASSTLEVKGDLRDGTGTAYTAGNVMMTVTASGSNGRGQTSQNTVTINDQAGKNLTIGSANVTFARTGGFLGRTISPNSQNVTLGSFTLTNSNNEDVKVTNMAVAMTFAGSMATTHLSDVKVTDSGTVVGQPTGTDNFTMDVTIPMNSSKTFVVTANVGSAPNGGSVTTNATVSYRGVSSSNPTTATGTGVAMTTNVAVAADVTVTKESSSAASQLVKAGTTVAAVKYNVKVATAPIKVTEMTFNASNIDRVTSIKVGGVTKQITATTGNTVTGLAIEVPSGTTGLDIPVEVTFGALNPNATPALTSDTTAASTITLTSVKFDSGNSTDTKSGLTLASNGMQIVASPVAITTVAAGQVATGLVAGNENKIGEVTVAADAAGNVRVNDVVFTTSFSGVTTGTLTAARIADGSQTVTGSACTVAGSAPTFTVTCEFGSASNTDSDGYSVAAGTTKTFSLYANVGGTFGSSGQSSVTSALSSDKTLFSWDDVAGGATNLNATNVFSYPTTGYTVRN